MNDLDTVAFIVCLFLVFILTINGDTNRDLLDVIIEGWLK